MPKLDKSLIKMFNNLVIYKTIICDYFAGPLDIQTINFGILRHFYNAKLSDVC